jgi:hypothetical protein
MAKAFKNGFDDAERKCRDNVDGPDEAVRMMRWVSMIEHISDPSDPARRDLLYGKEGLEVSRVNEQINNCLAFEVEFRSRADLKFGTRGTFTIQYHMEKIELEYNLANNEMSVEKPIQIETINFDPGTASVSCPASAQDGRVKIEIIANANYSYNSQRLVAMWLEILFNQKPIESFSCAGGPPTSGSFWQAALDEAYHLIGTTQAIASLPMRIVRLPEVYARFTETKATETFSGTLLTTVEIIHTPIE